MIPRYWCLSCDEGVSGLEELLDAGEAICHAFIVGELACGNLRNRPEIL
ncbi:MAG TPA: hypothetical protein P5244_04560 [Syntrophales bacterium]|nr:hypothetical protein [Syntrophales bacterium]HRT26528.1 hypothetical protein [Syntrophales bacterium]